MNTSHFFTALGKVRNFRNVGHLLKKCKPDLYSGELMKNNYVSYRYTGYIKHQIYKNDMLDCYLILWEPFSKSPVHDHSDRGCYFKVLDGFLFESRYKVNNDSSLLKFSDTRLVKDSVSYIDNKQGVHSIYNPTQYIVPSLHVYSPPDYVANRFELDK
jgi:hypothetical protein